MPHRTLSTRANSPSTAGNARRYDGERASWLRDAQVARAGRAEQIEPEQHIDARAGHADAAFRWRRGAAHIGDHGAGLLAQAANAAFLAYAPPPAAGAGALCLADTGVNVNPDTQQELVSASAVDGGSGNDVDPDGHGTTMAMIAGASGHGMIGACPQIKIVSVRATDTPTPAGKRSAPPYASARMVASATHTAAPP